MAEASNKKDPWVDELPEGLTSDQAIEAGKLIAEYAGDSFNPGPVVSLHALVCKLYLVFHSRSE
jgi:hypothetical protein